MRVPPNKQAAGTWGAGGSQANALSRATSENENIRLGRGIQVGLLDKPNGARLRISLSSWRGMHRVEIRETTEICPGTAFPTKSGVVVPIGLVDELIEALTAAKAKAVALGLFSEGRAKP
jgi:hypothetical protein